MKKFSLYSMVVLYIAAGLNHFIHPEYYIRIMPLWLSYHTELVLISGAAEIALGLLLLMPAFRSWAAWGIIILLIAVFPANVQMLLNYIQMDDPFVWIAIIRLPLQVLLIWWAYYFTKPG